MNEHSRRSILKAGLAGAAAFAVPTFARDDLAPVYDQIGKRRDETVRRIQQWIGKPTIAAENVGGQEGAPILVDLLRDAGFQRADRVETEGNPGVFAVYDVGAPKTLGLYFMYDVKQVDPSEWSSPPWEGRVVEKPGLGKAIVGRGAVNQKGPEGSFLAALHAIRGAGRKLPVNLVLVGEGEEEVGSPHQRIASRISAARIRPSLSRSSSSSVRSDSSRPFAGQLNAIQSFWSSSGRWARSSPVSSET